MEDIMNAREVLKNVWWVGAVDWDINDFHGYWLHEGTTYNAYIVKGSEKTVLFDTVKKTHAKELINHIKSVMNPEDIDILVVSHVEPDHSGSYREIVDLIKPEKIITTKAGAMELEKYYGKVDVPFQIIKTMDTESIGDMTLTFIETRMIHWPDSMFTYIPEIKSLISQDGFGEHWATSERFDDEVDYNKLMEHCKKYYANILPLYSPMIAKALKSVMDMGIEIDVIMPDHGVIWRKYVKDILAKYSEWTSMAKTDKAVVIYDTMWGSTYEVAERIAAGLTDGGLSCRVYKTTSHHRSDIATECLDAKAVVVGSPTLNNGIMPSVADVLCYLKGLKMTGKVAGAFGGYGWSGESVKILRESLEEMKYEFIGDGLKVMYKASEEDLQKAYEYGKEIAEKVMNNAL